MFGYRNGDKVSFSNAVNGLIDNKTLSNSSDQFHFFVALPAWKTENLKRNEQ